MESIKYPMMRSEAASTDLHSSDCGRSLSIVDTELATTREAHAIHSMGETYLERGDLDAAEELFCDALTAHPEEARFHKSLGVLRLSRKRPMTAFFHLTESLRIDPADAEAHLFLGDVLVRLQRWEEAALSYNNAIDRDPLLSVARANLTAVLLVLEQTATAHSQMN